MKTTLTGAQLRHRKFLLVLPLLAFPFVTMAFWALGGGKSVHRGNALQADTKGINTELPQAKFSDETKEDKLSIYEASLKELRHSAELDSLGGGRDAGFGSLTSNPADEQEAQIRQRLTLLQTELNRKPVASSFYAPERPARTTSASMGGDVDRLENLMAAIQGGGDDPEMKQLNAILEKIMDIQHPGRAKEKLKSLSEKNTGQVYAVSGSGQKDDLAQQTASPGNAFSTVIHQDQDIVSGSVVKLRLSDSIYVNGNLIPKNEFVYGIASVDGERLKLDIATLRYKNSILPVALSAYDLDGLEGLYIPGAISRDAVKGGTEEAIQSLQLMTMDPSVSAQVAGAGIQAAKGLFGKKAKQIRIKLKAGYKLLLRDTNQRN